MNNNYNAGVPPTNAHGTTSMSTRIESHIPGTQAHRERELLEHQNQVGMASGLGTGHQAAGVPHSNAAMSTQAPVYANDMGPAGGPMGGTGATRGGVAAVTAVPATHHGNTMGERVAEQQGRVGHASTGNATSATGTRVHVGDKVIGSVEAAVGHAMNNPVMEQKGRDRKTFGDPKHRQDGLAHTGAQPITQQQQGYAPGGIPAQQGSTNPQSGYAAPTQPPTGY